MSDNYKSNESLDSTLSKLASSKSTNFSSSSVSKSVSIGSSKSHSTSVLDLSSSSDSEKQTISNDIKLNYIESNDQHRSINNKQKSLNDLENSAFTESEDELKVVKLNEVGVIDYDSEVEAIIEEATSLIENNKSCIFGLYQIISFILISISWTVGNGLYSYASVFTANEPTYTCDYDNSTYVNYTVADENQCVLTNLITNATITCPKWSYETTPIKETIISEYNLVCNKQEVFPIALALEQTGYTFGLVFSVISDKIGRKPVFMIALIGMSVLGVTQYFIKNFYAYMIVGFLINFVSSGLDAVCVTLVLETVITKRRTSVGIGMEYIWVVVMACLGPLAYFINTWRELRLVIFIVIVILSILSVFLLQESITWLISTNRIDRAKETIEKVAKFNRLKNFSTRKNELFNKLTILAEYNEKMKKTDEKKCGTINLIGEDNSIRKIAKYPKYRLYVILMSLNWFATALIYDGLTYLNAHVGGNIFISWVLLNLIEFPAQLMCHFCLSRFGRRKTTCVMLITCGLTLVTTCITMLPELEDKSWLKLLLYLFAKFTSSQAYSTVIIHAPEIFPTNLRGFGYGLCLFSSKVTAIIAPFISLYMIKIHQWLPSVIYGSIATICGCLCLYCPETLSRPLPNSIEDVLKWTRDLSSSEWEKIKYSYQLDIKNHIKRLFCMKRSALISDVPSKNNKSSKLVNGNKTNKTDTIS